MKSLEECGRRIIVGKVGEKRLLGKRLDPAIGEFGGG